MQRFAQFYGYGANIDHLWNDNDEVITNKIDYILQTGHRVVIGYRTTGGALHFAVIYGKSSVEDKVFYKIIDPWGGRLELWSSKELIYCLNSVGSDDEDNIISYVKGILWLDF